MAVVIATPNIDWRLLDETAAHFGIRYGDFIEGARLLAVVRYDIALRRAALADPSKLQNEQQKEQP